MNMNSRNYTVWALAGAFLLALAVGCAQSPPVAKPAAETEEHATHGAHGAADPVQVVDDDERKLYLTPGGAYTEADIKANGNLTASQKFKGFQSNHNLKPKPGDRICPVTLTKANSQCTWVVGGNSYEFCCPPCVDEFVKSAKENPAALQPPDTFVKK